MAQGVAAAAESVQVAEGVGVDGRVCQCEWLSECHGCRWLWALMRTAE